VSWNNRDLERSAQMKWCLMIFFVQRLLSQWRFFLYKTGFSVFVRRAGYLVSPKGRLLQLYGSILREDRAPRTYRTNIYIFIYIYSHIYIIYIYSHIPATEKYNVTPSSLKMHRTHNPNHSHVMIVTTFASAAPKIKIFTATLFQQLTKVVTGKSSIFPAQK